MSKATILIIILIILAAGGIYWWQKDNINNLIFGELSEKGCTTEARVCPDGTVVVRVPPNCEFTPCPADLTANWQTYRNEEYGFAVKYPENLNAIEDSTSYGGTTGDQIRLLEKNAAFGIVIEIFGAGKNEKVTDAFRRIYAIDPSDFPNEQKDNKIIDGIEADYYKDVPGFTSYDEAVFIRKGCFFGIIRYALEETEFNKILSTFKFIK